MADKKTEHYLASIDPNFEPGYVKLQRSGILRQRGQALWQRMQACDLCPRVCGSDRLSGEVGICGASAQMEIAAFHPHFGEEAPLVGTGGSGTIFFSHCNLRCVFCINGELSQGSAGRRQSLENLADIMLHLQKIGCHNINVVTPTHYAPHIVLALEHAASRGLHLPLVYNTCGWERLEVLQLLDGIVDIYLPDFKYWEDRIAAKYSSEAATYPEVTRQALLEMQRQVGIAKPGPKGIMQRGLMIRHLVMPGGASGSRQVLQWIADHLPKDTYVNIMSQYQPVFRAREHPEIARRLLRAEYLEAVAWAQAAGLTNLEIQGWPY